MLITPEGPTWNPHSNLYKQNEDYHLDWKREILDGQYHNKAFLNESDDPLDIELVIAMCCDVHMNRLSEFCEMKLQLISDTVDESLYYNDQNEMPDWYGIPSDQNQVVIHLSSFNTTLDPTNFSQSLRN